jgi:hypothetical protein
MRRADRIAAGHALVVVVSSLDLPLYAYWNLAPGKFDDPDGHFPDGDLGMFVALLVEQRGTSRAAPFEASFDATRGAVRARSMLNLLDTSLWTLSYGIIRDYVWKAEAGVPVRWIHVAGADLIPSLRYAVTPIGPEYGIRSHYRVSRFTGLAYVRWSERTGAARQVGVGYSIDGWRPRGLKPTIAADVWSHTTEGVGFHAAFGLEFAAWPSRRAAFSVTAGAKSAGYLPGFPLDRGPYLEAGFAIKPW